MREMPRLRYATRVGIGDQIRRPLQSMSLCSRVHRITKTTVSDISVCEASHSLAPRPVDLFLRYADFSHFDKLIQLKKSHQAIQAP
jgi:hypothetical protein